MSRGADSPSFLRLFLSPYKVVFGVNDSARITTIRIRLAVVVEMLLMRTKLRSFEKGLRERMRHVRLQRTAEAQATEHINEEVALGIHTR